MNSIIDSKSVSPQGKSHASNNCVGRAKWGLIFVFLTYVIYSFSKKPTLFDSPIWSGYEVAGNEYFPTFSIMNPYKNKQFISITRNAIDYCTNERAKLFFMNCPQIKSLKVEKDQWWILYNNDDSYAVVVYQCTENEIIHVYF